MKKRSCVVFGNFKEGSKSCFYCKQNCKKEYIACKKLSEIKNKAKIRKRKSPLIVNCTKNNFVDFGNIDTSNAKCKACALKEECLDFYYSQFDSDKMIKASLKNENYMNKTCKSLANCIYNLLADDMITITIDYQKKDYFLENEISEKKRFYNLFKRYLAACRADEYIRNNRMSTKTVDKSKSIAEFDNYLKN